MALYVVAICGMVSSALALLFNLAVPLMQAGLASAGAVLLWLSDLILAINRFRVKLNYYPVNLAVYYAGQCLIALSASYGGG